MTVTFARLQRSIRSFRGSTARYVRPSRLSFDAGAEWASPTALDFDETTITAQRLGATVHYANERPIPPQQLVRDLQAMWHYLDREFDRAQRVLDADDPEGVRFDTDLARDMTTMTATLKTWPRIEGVTVPLSRETLECTL